jgi:hypothetical protein
LRGTRLARLPSTQNEPTKGPVSFGVQVWAPIDKSGGADWSGRPCEGDIVFDDNVRTDGHLPRVRQVQAAEGDLVTPDLAQEICEYIDGQLLAGAAPIAEAEWCEAGMVADRQRLAVDDAEYTVPNALLAMAALRPSLTFSVVRSNGDLGKPICLLFASSTWALVGTSR